jgi:hypothetical protein
MISSSWTSKHSERDPGPMTTDVNGEGKLEPQLATTTKACGCGSRLKAGTISVNFVDYRVGFGGWRRRSPAGW